MIDFLVELLIWTVVYGAVFLSVLGHVVIVIGMLWVATSPFREGNPEE